jgi:uncharacterized protein (DUF697 family)
MKTKMKTKAEAEVEARNIVDKWVVGAALTGWIPFSALFLTAADAAMIRQVADAFGVGVFDMNAVKAHVGGLLMGAVGGGVVAEVAGWIPVVGWAVKSVGMAYKAEAIGEAVIEYFSEASPLPD